jgi:hypothetical protein
MIVELRGRAYDGGDSDDLAVVFIVFVVLGFGINFKEASINVLIVYSEFTIFLVKES